MAREPLRPCPRGHLYRGRRCPRCEQRRQRARPSAYQRGYGPAWREYSANYLAAPGHQVCALCHEAPAELVDHIQAHKGDARLFWDPSNHQPACARCNRRKCVTEESTFARRGPRR